MGWMHGPGSHLPTPRHRSPSDLGLQQERTLFPLAGGLSHLGSLRAPHLELRAVGRQRLGQEGLLLAQRGLRVVEGGWGIGLRVVEGG